MEDRVIEQVKTELVLANRILAHQDVIDDFGHVSVRNPLDPERYFLSRSRSPQNVTAEDIIEFDLKGDAVEDTGSRSLYSERPIHGAIYAARPDVHAVAHHHARSVLPFTVTDVPLRPVFHMGSVIGKTIPVWDSRREFGDTNMLIDRWEMGVSLARALADNTVVLMARHGAVVAASGIKDVVFTSVYLKENAETLLQSLALGEPDYLSDGEIELTAKMLRRPLAQMRAWQFYTKRSGYEGV